MIKTVIQWTDVHVGAPHQLEHNIQKILEDFETHQHDPEVIVIGTGDIIDNKNVKRSKMPFYARMRNELKRIMGKFYKFGNHECEVDPDGYISIEEDIMWMHYHVKNWCNSFINACKKVIRWENKKEGLKWWKYLGYRFKHRVVYRGKEWHPSEQEITDLVAFAKKNNCKFVFLGHIHKFYDQIHDGIRICNGGRGRKVYHLER